MEFQLPQILFQIVNFSVVFGAVSYLLYKPVLTILDERANRIEEAQKAARKTLAEQERLDTLEKERIKKAEQEAAQILEQARQNAVQMKADATTEAKAQAQQVLAAAQASWTGEKEQYLQAVKKQFSEAVIETAQKVIGAELDAKKHAKIIDSQIDQLLEAIK